MALLSALSLNNTNNALGLRSIYFLL